MCLPASARLLLVLQWVVSSITSNDSLPSVLRWPAMGIHGDKSQQERDWVLNGELKHYFFFSGKIKLMKFPGY